NGVDLVELADVAPDEQPEPGPDPEHERAHGRVVPGAVAAQEVDPLAAAIEFARPIRDVARDRPQCGVDEQIRGPPFLIAPDALVDDRRETGEPAPLGLLRETANLGLDDLVGLPFEVSERRP